MIDFVKIKFIDPRKVEEYLGKIINPVIINYEMKSDKRHYPYKTTFEKTLYITVNKETAYINGSIHKLYNYKEIQQPINYNDFTYSKLCKTIDFLISKIPGLEDGKITQLEFGFNIDIQEDVFDYINNNVLMHNLLSHTGKKHFKSRGLQIEYKKGDTVLKLYKKENENNDKTLLRIELKFLNSKLYKKYGISNIVELKNKFRLKNIFTSFLESFDKLIIIDDVNPKIFTPEDKCKFFEFTSEKFWKLLKTQKSPTTYYNKKKEFEELIQKYDLDASKRKIRDLIVTKFNELLST